jgi:hypothetical protein
MDYQTHLRIANDIQETLNDIDNAEINDRLLAAVWTMLGSIELSDDDLVPYTFISDDSHYVHYAKRLLIKYGELAFNDVLVMSEQPNARNNNCITVIASRKSKDSFPDRITRSIMFVHADNAASANWSLDNVYRVLNDKKHFCTSSIKSRATQTQTIQDF